MISGRTATWTSWSNTPRPGRPDGRSSISKTSWAAFSAGGRWTSSIASISIIDSGIEFCAALLSSMRMPMEKDDSVYLGHMLDRAQHVIGKVRGLTRADFDSDENLRLAL